MSQWKEVCQDDIQYDHELKEFNILVGSDDWGNKYLTIKEEDIMKAMVIEDDRKRGE